MDFIKCQNEKKCRFVFETYIFLELAELAVEPGLRSSRAPSGEARRLSGVDPSPPGLVISSSGGGGGDWGLTMRSLSCPSSSIGLPPRFFLLLRLLLPLPTFSFSFFFFLFILEKRVVTINMLLP